VPQPVHDGIHLSKFKDFLIMLTIDDSRWPLVFIHFQGTDTHETMEQFYNCFEGWLARQERFSLVIRRSDAEAAESNRSPAAKELRKLGIAWTKVHKPQISQYCAGVALLADSAKLIALWSPIVAKVTQNMYGCPGRVFGSPLEAEQWAASQLGIGVELMPARPLSQSVSSSLQKASPSLRQIILKQRVTLTVSGILAAIGAALGLVPYYLIYLVSRELLQQSSAAIDSQFVWTLPLLAVGAVTLKGICIGASTRIAHIAAYTILYNTRIELARKLGALPLGYFNSRTTGEIKKIIHEDVEQLEEGLAHLIPDIVAGLTVPILTGLLLFIVDWRMTLATLASAAIALSIFGFIMSRGNVSNLLLIFLKGSLREPFKKINNRSSTAPVTV
jgi:ATP-binding cassette subfamily B protein